MGDKDPVQMLFKGSTVNPVYHMAIATEIMINFCLCIDKNM